MSTMTPPLCEFTLGNMPCQITSALVADTNKIFKVSQKNAILVPTSKLNPFQGAVTILDSGITIDLNQCTLKMNADDSDAEDTTGIYLGSGASGTRIVNGGIDGFGIGILSNDGGIMVSDPNTLFVSNMVFTNQVLLSIIFDSISSGGGSYLEPSVTIEQSTFLINEGSVTSIVLNGSVGPFSIKNNYFEASNDDISTAIHVGETPRQDVDVGDITIQSNLIINMNGITLGPDISKRTNTLVESNCIQNSPFIGIDYSHRYGSNTGSFLSAVGNTEIKNNVITNSKSSGIALDQEECSNSNVGCINVAPEVTNNCIGNTAGGPGIWSGTYSTSVVGRDFGPIPNLALSNNQFFKNTGGDFCQGDFNPCILEHGGRAGVFLSDATKDAMVAKHCGCPLNKHNTGARSNCIITK